MPKHLLLLLLLLLATPARADASLGLVPHPHTVRHNAGKLVLPRSVVIAGADSSLAVATRHLVEALARAGCTATVRPKHRAFIAYHIEQHRDLDESYRLTLRPDGIDIRAAHPRGAFYATMTLLQLLDAHTPHGVQPTTLPCLDIADAPRFPFRALMLDPARHFLPLDQVKGFIDRMARFKFNALQLHLSDDQGWRVDIPELPQLVRQGAQRSARDETAHNGFYTLEQLRELRSYAAARGVELIPEIDVPGHTAALLTALPHLRCDIHRDSLFHLGSTDNVMLSAVQPAVYATLDTIFAALGRVFPPGSRLHLGGDESALERNWGKSPEHRIFMQQQGHTTLRELMAHFFRSTLERARRHGFRPMLWCELDNIRMPAQEYLFPYPNDVELVTWRMGLTPKCVALTRQSGHKLILAPGEAAYFDYPQYPGDLPEHNNWGMPITTLEQTYSYDLRSGIALPNDRHIIGVMGTLWGEAIADMARAYYMAYPRALALSEVGWTAPEQRNWERFRNALPPVLDALRRSGTPYRVPFEIYR